MLCVAPVEVVRLMTHFLPLVTFQQHPQLTHFISASHHCEKILSPIPCYKPRVTIAQAYGSHAYRQVSFRHLGATQDSRAG